MSLRLCSYDRESDRERTSHLAASLAVWYLAASLTHSVSLRFSFFWWTLDSGSRSVQLWRHWLTHLLSGCVSNAVPVNGSPHGVEAPVPEGQVRALISSARAAADESTGNIS
jgi:hypothetical protein